MIRVVEQAGILVQKSGLRFFEGDTVLRQVGSSLAAIPGKLDIAHSNMLAISVITESAALAEAWSPAKTRLLLFIVDEINLLAGPGSWVRPSPQSGLRIASRQRMYRQSDVLIRGACK